MDDHVTMTVNDPMVTEDFVVVQQHPVVCRRHLDCPDVLVSDQAYDLWLMLHGLDSVCLNRMNHAVLPSVLVYLKEIN